VQVRVVAALLLVAALAGQLAAAAPARWSQEFVNKVYTVSLPLVFGGDEYRWTGSSLSLESSGRVYYVEFSSTPSDWRALSGTWTVSGGFLAASPPDPSSWGIYEYGSVIPTSSEPQLFFEAYMVSASATRGGISLSSSLGDTSDPQTSPSIVATVDAKAGICIEAAPPLAEYPPAPPENGDVWLRLVYYPAGRYEAFADVGDGWVPVALGPTVSSDVALRLIVAGDGEWRFGYVAVYRERVVYIRGLPAGSVVQLYSGSRLVASAMADATGYASLDVSGAHIPIRDAKVKVYMPPMTVHYYDGTRDKYSGAVGGFLAVAGSSTVDIWYTVSLGESTTLYSARWILPPAASVVNLTLVNGSSRTAYTPASVSPFGPLTEALFSFPGGAAAEKMILYLEAPNIVSGFAIYSVERDVLDPAATAAGEALRALINVSDGSSPLSEANVALVLKRVPDAATLLTRTGSTDGDGEAALPFTGPAYPYRAIGLAYYSPLGTEWYFGIAEEAVKLAPTLTLTAPASVAEGSPLSLVARLHAGTRGITGAAIAFQVRVGSAWVTVATAVTNSTGYAAASYVPPGSGVAAFRAVYGGDEWHAAAVSPTIAVTVKRMPSISVEAPPSAPVGRAFTVNVTLSYGGSPLPGKRVVLQRSLDGSTWEYVADGVTGGDGVASFTVVEASRGRYFYRGFYAGDDVYASAVSPAAAVDIVLATASMSIAVQGANATLPAVVSVRLLGLDGPLAGKSIEVRVNGTAVCTAVTGAGGWARCTWVPPSPGWYHVEAVFEGDEEYGPARAEALVEAHKLSTRLHVSLLEKAYAGRPVRVSVRLTLANGTPIPGSVEYEWAGGSGSIHLADGAGVATLTPPGPGVYTVHFRYGGGPLYSPSSAVLEITAEKVPVKVSVEGADTAVEGGELELRVSVTDIFGEPVEGARVRVYLAGIEAASGVTGADGVATIKVPVAASGRLPLRVVVEEGDAYTGVDLEVGVVEAAPAPWKVAAPIVAVLAAILLLLYLRRRRGGVSHVPGGGAAPVPPGEGPVGGLLSLGVVGAEGVEARSPAEEEPVEACLYGCGEEGKKVVF